MTSAALAKWVNAELRKLGLALVCPKTRRPAILLADPGGVPGVGRFQFQSETPEGRRGAAPIVRPRCPGSNSPPRTNR